MCQIKLFPSIILHVLPALREFYLNDNKIESLPPEIILLSRLETLNISNNAIARLPPQLADLPSLHTLLCDGNPTVYPRRAILQKGTAAILKYLQEMRS
jgi:Leucine-rich repeat (LRR) protein